MSIPQDEIARGRKRLEAAYIVTHRGDGRNASVVYTLEDAAREAIAGMWAGSLESALEQEDLCAIYEAIRNPESDEWADYDGEEISFSFEDGSLSVLSIPVKISARPPLSDAKPVADDEIEAIRGRHNLLEEQRYLAAPLDYRIADKDRDTLLRALDAEREARVKAEAIPAPDLQASVQAWCVQCFGETTASDVVERNWRFLEEALELVQSLGGSKEDALKLVDYVYGREAGHPPQEVGGVMITLSALCAARGIDWYTEAMREYLRIMRPEVIEKIRAKHASKPHRSPLPGDYKHAATLAKDTP